jgi:hypothetical protein
MTKAVNLAAVGSNATSTGTLLTAATAQASTSGTSINFTDIPSWVKRITVVLSGVSTNGTSNSPLVQLGDSGGIETSGYGGYVAYLGPSTASTGNSIGFLLNFGVNAAVGTSGIVTLCNITGQTWVMAYTGTYDNTAYILVGSGAKTLSATLDRVRITTVNGTDAFDAGTINILYE